MARCLNLNFGISASDPDATTPVLTAEDVPANATFTDNGDGTGTFDFDPDFIQVGVYNVRFIASDGALADTEVVAITVNEAGNQYPVLAAIGPQTVTEGYILNFGVAATDPDATLPVLTAEVVPANAVFTDNGDGTGLFDFAPIYDQAGVYNVRFIASDGALADTEIVAITVIDAPAPAAITTLNAQVNGESIELTWQPVTVDTAGVPVVIDHYVVYRGTRAYFAASSSDSIGWTDAVTVVFTDADLNGANVVGDTATNYFYTVAAVAAAGNMSEYSNRVGECDYAIVTTSTTDFNYVSVPFDATGLTVADDLIASIGSSNVFTVSRFVSASQSYENRFALGFGVNFPIIPGGIYQVNAQVELIWTVAGRVPAPGTIDYPIVVTSTTDFSFISIPFEEELNYSVAQDVIDALPGVLNTLNRFVPTSQSFESRFSIGFGVNFRVRPGEVYQTNAKIEATFPVP